MDLWPHQQNALDELDAAISKGCKRICLCSPTGGGKSRMMIERIKTKKKETTIYTHRRMLLEQMAGNLDKNGIWYGLRASGHQTALATDVQLSMIQTESHAVLKYESREIHDAKEVFVDEFHVACNGQALQLQDLHREEHDAVIIGVTATPLGIGHAADKLIVAGTNSQLRECGAHVPAIHYAPDEPSTALVGTVKIGEGECGISKTKRAVFAKRVFGSVVENYRRLNPRQTPALLFAPGVAESIWFCEELNKQGIPAAHIDGENCMLNGELVPTNDDIKH